MKMMNFSFLCFFFIANWTRSHFFLISTRKLVGCDWRLKNVNALVWFVFFPLSYSFQFLNCCRDNPSASCDLSWWWGGWPLAKKRPNQIARWNNLRRLLSFRQMGIFLSACQNRAAFWKGTFKFGLGWWCCHFSEWCIAETLSFTVFYKRIGDGCSSSHVSSPRSAGIAPNYIVASTSRSTYCIFIVTY